MKPFKKATVKKVSTLTRDIFTHLSRKRSVSETARRLKKSRQTILNHIKLLQKRGYITTEKNPTKDGNKFFTDFSYTQDDKIHLHKLQIYSKVNKYSHSWKNKRVTFQKLNKYHNWAIKNNEITEFSIKDIRIRATPRKLIFHFTDLKANSPLKAYENIETILFELRDYFRKTFNIELSSNFFITEQEIASKRDTIARIVNAAGQKGHISTDGRFLLEIYDHKKEKRAHVDLSDVEDFETVHARHAEDDMDSYLKHISDAKKNHLKKQVRDWLLKDPPTLSYQYRTIKGIIARIEAMDLLLKKIEDANTKTTESVYLLSEAINRLVEVQRK